MSDKLTKKDREFLKRIGVATNGHKASEPAPDTSPVFSAEDMQRRWEKLKAEGRVPPLADVLRIIKAATESAPKEGE